MLRSSLQWVAAGLYRRGTVREFGEGGQDSNCYWLSGQRPWARFDHALGGWVIPWPQSLVIDPARLPERG